MAIDRHLQQIAARVKHGLSPVSKSELENDEVRMFWTMYNAQFVLKDYTMEEKLCYITRLFNTKAAKPEKIKIFLQAVAKASNILNGKKVRDARPLNSDHMADFLSHAYKLGYVRGKNNIARILQTDHDYRREQKKIAAAPKPKRQKHTPEEKEAIREQRNAALREQTRQKQETIKEQMPYYVTHKIRLAPNNRQKAYLQKCFGVARFCFNWCYDRWMEEHEKGNMLYASDLAKQFNMIARKEYPFTYDVTQFAKKSGFDAFGAAQQALFDGKGFPQRKKRRLHGSFHYPVGNRKQPILCDNNPDIPDSKPSKKRQYLLIPSFGYIKTMEKLRFRGILTRITIRMEGDGHYYASLLVAVSQDEWKLKHQGYGIESNVPIGIDLGVKTLATLSNGMKIEPQKRDEKLYSQQKRLQWHIAKLVEAHPHHTSNRQKRLSVALAKVKARLRHQREDYLHKVTSALAYKYKRIAVENLNVKAMLNDNLTSRILEASFYHIRELLQQKMTIVGHELLIAEKFMPTTRICSQCGHVGEDVALEKRTYRCTQCGAEIDRDLNAAVNLARLIGLGEPNFHSADKILLDAILQRSGISTNQAVEEKQAGPRT